MAKDIRMNMVHSHVLRSVYWFNNELIKIQPIKAEGYKYCTVCNRMVKEVGEAF